MPITPTVATAWNRSLAAVEQAVGKFGPQVKVSLDPAYYSHSDAAFELKDLHGRLARLEQAVTAASSEGSVSTGVQSSLDALSGSVIGARASLDNIAQSAGTKLGYVQTVNTGETYFHASEGRATVRQLLAQL